ncbi:EF-hand domain (C-terminal) containing [Perkinsus olseni]|uniref:EF-hand domain (C-terminal) containing n=1 Tax=Perkinsus olseni TaxID=32597 RepID=A0A7J6PTL0_PEROL|nr:EF-hand domain (C-terminal) containing [Perkinsus olseni]
MDDLSTEQYERRPFTIFYFLSDDTIEIREQYPLNCGRDNFPIFFKRGRVAKDSMPVLGPSDPLPPPGVYYKVDDLYVGQTIRLVWAGIIAALDCGAERFPLELLLFRASEA